VAVSFTYDTPAAAARTTAAAKPLVTPTTPTGESNAKEIALTATRCHSNKERPISKRRQLPVRLGQSGQQQRGDRVLDSELGTGVFRRRASPKAQPSEVFTVTPPRRPLRRAFNDLYGHVHARRDWFAARDDYDCNNDSDEACTDTSHGTGNPADRQFVSIVDEMTNAPRLIILTGVIEIRTFA
jgi:hypothetical protein